MQAQPRRLGQRNVKRTLLKPGAASAFTKAAMSAPRRVMRAGRAALRLLAITLWTLLAIALQSLFVRLPGRLKVVFARRYWATMCVLLGMQVRVVGTPARRTRSDRPVIYASNHSSWADILVLGGRLEACFISKGEVARWPVVSVVARLGRTVFVSRTRASTGREERDIGQRLDAGDDLILFPEGTSSDGSRVLPFRSTFFAAAKPPERAGAASPQHRANMPLIQPVSLVYDRLAGMPVGRTGRPIFSWFGDMDLGSHVWRLAQWRGMRATILLHDPLDPADFASRKALAAATWQAVAEGAAKLRQNRPVGAAPAAATGTAPGSGPRAGPHPGPQSGPGPQAATNQTLRKHGPAYA